MFRNTSSHSASAQDSKKAVVRTGLARRVSLLFLVFSVVWIIGTSQMALVLSDSTVSLAYIETFKGLIFVSLSAILIYALIQQGVRGMEQAELDLSEQERRLRTLMGNLPGMAYRMRYDESWTIEFVSDAVVPVTGYRAEDFQNNYLVTYEELTHPLDRKRVRDEINAAIHSRQPFVIEYRIQHKDKGVRRVREHGMGLFGEAGQIEALEGFIEDITERYEAEQALRQSEARLRLLVEGARDLAIVMLDPAGIVVSWNTAAERLTQYSEAEILGRHFACFYNMDDIAAGKPGKVLQSARAEGSASAEGWVLRKDGTTFWGELLIHPLFDDAGDLYGFGTLTRDLTEKRKTREALQQSEQRYRDLYEHTPSMYFSLTAAGDVISVNQFGAEQLGYSKDELLGQSVYKVIHPDERELAKQKLAEILAHPGQIFRWEMDKICKDGRRIRVREAALANPDPGAIDVLQVLCEEIA